MALVAGVDSSTQACKVVVRDADTGELVREGRAPRPPGTEVDPASWESAGGGAQSEAVAQVAPTELGVPVLVPPAGEYVADGAARQAAWVLPETAASPHWSTQGARAHEADPSPQVRQRYAEVRDLTTGRHR